MIKQFLLKQYNVFLFIIIILMASCHGKNSSADTNSVPIDTTTTQPGDTTAIIIPPVDSSGIVDNKALTGSLYILYVNATDFLALADARIVFKFYVKKLTSSTDILVLRGWSNNDNVFTDGDDDPDYGRHDVELTELRRSSFTFGPGNYLGNLILRRAVVRWIKQNIGTSSAVLFVPRDPAITKGHISYQIGFTNVAIDSSINKNLPIRALLTSKIVNPSPPRNARVE